MGRGRAAAATARVAAVEAMEACWAEVAEVKVVGAMEAAMAVEKAAAVGWSEAWSEAAGCSEVKEG